MFDLPALEAAARLVHGAFPPTPQYAWPLLAARSRRRGLGQAREPYADRRLQGARRAGLSSPGCAAAQPGVRGIITRHARQSRPERWPMPAPRTACRSPSSCPRQQHREERRHAGARRAPDRARRGFRRGARCSDAPGRGRGADLRARHSMPIWCVGVATYALELFRGGAAARCASMCRSASARGICGVIRRATCSACDRDHRRAEHRGAGLCAVLRAGRGRDDQPRRYPRRRHGPRIPDPPRWRSSGPAPRASSR